MLSTLGVLATEKEKEFKKFEEFREFKEKETGARGRKTCGAIHGLERSRFGRLPNRLITFAED